MTDTLRLIARMSNLDRCREFLFQSHEENIDTWLQKCIIAISSTGERLVLAHGSALVVLVLKGDKWSLNEFVVSSQWDAGQCLSAKEEVTSVACLTLVATGQASHDGPDWTCIAVGFSTGYLRFFSENMDLLAAEQLHNEPLLHIKAISYRKGRKVSPEGGEVVHCVYPSVICTLSGFSFFQTLRGSRGQLALRNAKASGSTSSVSLEYKKFSLSGTSSNHQTVHDACFLGCPTISNFDHLLSSSVTDGFYCNYRPSPPQHSIVSSTGNRPWVKFQSCKEGAAAPMELTDVAVTVITKLPGWLGFGSKKSAEPQSRVAEKLEDKSALLDRRREGRRMIASPDGSLLAIADSLGRVSLVDVHTGIAIRMWKGYRDAQCGFLEVEEELPKARHKKHSSSNPPQLRRVVFLILYAPKKGIIEIFTLRHGPRVASLHVSKNGQLIYTPHGLLGFSTPPKKGHNSSSIPVAFISEDGLADFVVPFHCALNDESSARAKDMHLLKQLRAWLKAEDFDEDKYLEELISVTKKLKTDECRLLAIDSLSDLKQITPKILKAVVNVFSQSDSLGEKTPESSLNELCGQLTNVLTFYDFVLTLKLDKKDKVLENGSKTLHEILFLSEKETTCLLGYIDKLQNSSKRKSDSKVTFNQNTSTGVAKFLKCLDLGCGENVKAKGALRDDDLRHLGELLFNGVEERISHLPDWLAAARSSNIQPDVFLKSLMHYWLNKFNTSVELHMRIFVLLLDAVSSLSDSPVSSGDNNSESEWWESARLLIRSCVNVVPALSAAVCCRAVSLQLESIHQEGKQDNNYLLDWENVSADTWQWDLLITHLEDTACLNALLSSTCDLDRKMGPSSVAFEHVPLSLSELVAHGEGVVSELVSKWLCQFSIPPPLLVDKSDIEFQAALPAEEDPRQRSRKRLKGEEELPVFPLIEVGEEIQPTFEVYSKILDQITLMKKRFPHSLTSSALISNVAWEFVLHWHRDVTRLELLQAGVSYLKVIPSAHLRAGVSGLIWSTYLKVTFEGICRLLSKVGRVPTDQLCFRELGFPRQKVAPFLECACQTLSVMLDACAERPHVPFIQRTEALWEKGQPSLVAVALSQSVLNDDLMLLHQQVAISLHFVAALELRHPKLLTSLFGSLKTELFGDLTKRCQIPLYHTGLASARLSFLRKVVSGAVQTIHEVEDDAGGTRLDTETSSQWLRQCFQLALSWRLPIDDLRRHHVCELYSCGFDRLAEEAIPAVNETGLMASQLLVIAGQRVKAMIAASSDPSALISTLSPSLSSWLNSLNEDSLREMLQEVVDTETLMSRVLQWLPPEHPNHQLAVLLAENLPALHH